MKLYQFLIFLVPITTIVMSPPPLQVDSGHDYIDDYLRTVNKKDWDQFKNSGWGKRVAISAPNSIDESNWKIANSDWNNFKSSWGKRRTSWNNIKGAWGKRPWQEAEIQSEFYVN